MDLKVKKMKVDIVTKSLSSPQDKNKLLIPPVKGEDYENLFPYELLLANFFKTFNRRMHLLLKYPFGEFKQKTWWLQLLSFCHHLLLS